MLISHYNRYQAVTIAALMMMATAACAYKPHEVMLPDNTKATALGKDDGLYVKLLRLRAGGNYQALYALLSKEVEERKDTDSEGCIHAAGDLATISMEHGHLATASTALDTVQKCHHKLIKGKIEHTFIKETHVKMRGGEGSNIERSPSIRCNAGHCKVKLISNYFSWSRPLEDYTVQGKEGKHKTIAVIGAIIGTPFLVGPFTGYRNTRSAFRGTLRYERPKDPERHMQALFAELTTAALKVEFTSETRAFHDRTADFMANIGNDTNGVLRYRLRAALAYGDLTGVNALIAKHADSVAKLEALDYFKLVADAPPVTDRAAATSLVEPYYYKAVTDQLSQGAVDSYLARFDTGDRAAEVRVVQQTLEDFRTNVASDPRALLSFWNQHRGDPTGKLALEPLADLVKQNVSILESQVYVATGDGDWVNDVVEHMRPEGVYGGERFNVFILGAYVNRGTVELPVRLTCNYHLLLTVTVRALIVSSTDTTPIDKSSTFLAYLPPGEPKVFACLLKNQQSGGGVSAGLLGQIDGSVGFRDPPVSLQPTFAKDDITLQEIRAQDTLLASLQTRGNVETKVSPWESERLANAGPDGAMVHFHFSHLGGSNVPFDVTDDAGQSVYRDTVILNISDFRTALPRGKYTISLKKHGLACDFLVGTGNTHIGVNIKAGKCTVE